MNKNNTTPTLEVKLRRAASCHATASFPPDRPAHPLDGRSSASLPGGGLVADGWTLDADGLVADEPSASGQRRSRAQAAAERRSGD
nr:unnamed protein product [Digitaria exilis]